jgi:hypothetical protein
LLPDNYYADGTPGDIFVDIEADRREIRGSPASSAGSSA